LILIKPRLSGRFASTFRFSSAVSVTVNAAVGITVGITVEDGRFCPVATVTIAVRVHILIVGDTG
jgi:hypothetical protein